MTSACCRTWQQWRQIGVDAKIDTIEQTAYIGKLVGADFQAAFFRWYAFPDPDSSYYFWSKEQADPNSAVQLNFTGYWSQTTENAVTWGRTASSFEARQPGYEALAKDRNAAAVDLWLFNTPYSLIGENNLRGLNWFRTIGFGNYLPKPWMKVSGSTRTRRAANRFLLRSGRSLSGERPFRVSGSAA